MNKTELFSMAALLEVFGVSFNEKKSEFEHAGNTYSIEFEWKDGLRLLINNKLQINEDDLPSFSDDESPCPQQEVVLNHQRSSSLRTSKIPAVAGVLSYKVIPTPSNRNKDLTNYIEMFRNVITEQTQLIFSFASPIMNPVEMLNYPQLPPLDCKKEFAQIERALKECNTNVQYTKMVATLSNISDILIQSPYVLHFSGHGIKNSYEFIGTYASLHRNEGDMLVFEDEK